jgi:hypothetical protein
MASKNAKIAVASLVAEWSLPSVATLGSSVRAVGIERELRRRMPIAARKSVSVAGANVVLCMPKAEADAFDSASRKITETLEMIEQMPVLPSEAEDILSISSRERHKWLKDGRLKSVGTRTVRMRGRAKSVTFHVFDPRHIEEALNGDLPALWREEDAMAAAEHRRRAAGKAALRRRDKSRMEAGETAADAQAEQQPQLNGWEAFEAEGFLR